MSADPTAVPPFYWPPGDGEPLDDPPSEGAVLGHDEGTFLVADHSGTVSSVAAALGAEGFVNTSERQFLESLRRLDEAWRARAALSEGAAWHQAQRLRSELDAIDPAALDDPGNWWALVLEQLEQGVL